MLIVALQLSLYVNQDEYIPGIADGAGIRLVIHNKTHDLLLLFHNLIF